MKYIRKFENHAAYEAAESGLILPNVSLCVSENEVHYNPSGVVPPTPSHDYVEISGVKWATMNVGANSVTDKGLFFSWGGTSGYTVAQVGVDKNFEESDYELSKGDGDFTKYNWIDELTTLQSVDDAVTAAWGGSWRMPTISEWQTLCHAVEDNVVESAWTTDYQGSGVSGLVLIDKTDSSKVLFFPAAGSCYNGSVYSVGSDGCYWTTSLATNEGIEYAYFASFGHSDFYPYINYDSYEYRWEGFSIRGVFDE